MNQENRIGSTWLATLLWGAAGLVAAAVMAPLEPNLLEEGLILHLAQRMLDGEHLYRDLVAFTGPLPFELLALLFRAFGEEIAVARVVLVLLSGLAAAGTYDLACRSRASIAAHGAAACVASVPMLLFPFFSIYFYTTLAFYISLIAAAAAARGIESDRWAIATGVLIACAALCKQSVGGLLALTLLGAFAIAAPPGRKLRLLLATGAGGAVVAAITLAAYALRGDLSDLVHSLVVLPLALGETFNAPYMNFWPPGRFTHEIHVNKPLYLPFSFVMRNGVFSEVSWPMVLFTQLLYALPFLALGATALRLLRGRLPPAVWIHTGLLVALMSNLYPRTDWGHLVFVLAPAFVQLSLLAPVRSGQASSLLRRVVVGGLLLVLSASCVFEAVDLYARSKPGRLGPRVPLRAVSAPFAGDELARVIQYLQRHANPEEYIFVPRSEPLIYFATNTRNPTPYSGVLPGMREEQERVILEGLEKVRFVVMSEIDQPLYTYYREELPGVQAYLERYFTLPREFLGKRNASWIVILERSEDRGNTVVDLFEQQENARAWIRDSEGRVIPTEERAPVLASRHNRRPLPYLLGPGGGGIDFDVELPDSAFLEASVGFKSMLGMGARYEHQRRVRLAVSIRGAGGGFERMKSVPAFFRGFLDHGWMPVEVDLSAYSGQRVTLRLELVPSGPVDSEAMAWWGSPRITQRVPEAEP